MLVDEATEALYAVEDPQLGEAEAALIIEMACVLGGRWSVEERKERV